MTDDAPVGIVFVGLPSATVVLVVVDNGTQVVTMTVGVSAQLRQRDAVIVLLQ